MEGILWRLVKIIENLKSNMDKTLNRKVGYVPPQKVKDKELQKAAEHILDDPNLKKSIRDGINALVEDNVVAIPIKKTNGKAKSNPKKTQKGKDRGKKSPVTKLTPKKPPLETSENVPKKGRPISGVNTKVISFSVRKDHAEELRAFMFAKIAELKGL